MKILILDDIKHRHDVFVKRYMDLYPSAEIVNAYCYSDFVNNWKAKDWDLVHLDHDLDDFYHSPDSYTAMDGSKRFYNGQDATNVVIEDVNNGKKKPSVIIHSINGTAAQWMLHDFKKNNFDVIWDPFTQDDWFV